VVDAVDNVRGDVGAGTCRVVPDEESHVDFRGELWFQSRISLGSRGVQGLGLLWFEEA
jgi:hypothetical protein